MSSLITFQDAVMRLHTFWAGQGCVLWNPYNIQVGAGTMNPATFLRVLGPEPWKVGYVEPSVRPDDGRYGDNPNRMQLHHQYQVILKPDPGNPQEIYLQSLEALGINRREHDIRFVEDNWESPALGAWGLGWEVWLDGQEITQFTYFQQAGGQTLNPVSVELTYGIDRIVLALQGVDSVWDIQWTEGLTYGEIFHRQEWEHCKYYFEIADVEALTEVYNTYEREALNALALDPPLVLPAHDYVLKCSHLFNVLDTRGAIGVVERAEYFRRMQRLAAKVAAAYVAQRREMGYPWLPEGWQVDAETDTLTIPAPEPPKVRRGTYPGKPAPFLLEIGTEELPSADLDAALKQLEELVPAMLSGARLDYESITIGGTPRRLVVYVEGLAPAQRSEEFVRRGPPARVAFDGEGNPTRAALGFARSLGVDVADLERREVNGGEYVVAVVKEEGRSAPEVLSERLPELIASLRFEKSMRWNWSGVAFSRPIRWLVALFGKGVVPFEYAGVHAGRTTRGTRPLGSPEIELAEASAYFDALSGQGILVDPAARRAEIEAQIGALAAEVGGAVKDDPGLLDEVTNLVEQPTALRGRFGLDDAEAAEFLRLPAPVLTTVMRKHQRYFAVVDGQGNLLPYFIAVRNGDAEHLEKVIHGNEHVIRARFADARFFYNEDIKRPLSEYLPDLKGLIFQEKLGSYYEKALRLEWLTERLGGLLGLKDEELEMATRAARLAKADLTTKMVVEMTSLQGIMGREYALLSGEPQVVADAIAEHYRPRFTGDDLPQTWPGVVVALADRLDSLVGLFAVGMEPTGSADPYGLRRAALGIVQILLGREIDLDLREAIEWTAQGYAREMGRELVSEGARAAVLGFIAGRLRVVLRESYRHDVVEAVLAEQGHNPYRAARHAEQLTRWVAREDWQTILDAYARCARITRSQKEQYDLRPDLFREEVERKLYAAYTQAAGALGPDPDVDTFLSAFEPLVSPITAFFAPADEGGVLVMHEDEALRQNRLALLQHIVALAKGVADFSQLEGF
ncbi:MAG TPA: glycine--tRNA ligase subunit beta [Chloroflexi bacterium]|nr:glycine--tRNA ligase subunit beta [Chloroflexota bacterium]